MFAAGDLCYCEYGGDRGVVHARLVLAHVEAFDHVILTPDLDLYVETLDASNGDFIRFWAPTPNGSIPAGVPAARVYAFGAMDVADYRNYLYQGTLEARAERIRRGLPADAMAAAPVAPLPGGGVGAVAAQAPPPAGSEDTWVVMESEGPYRRGDVLAQDPTPLPANSIVQGLKALVPAGPEFIYAKKVRSEDAPSLKLDDLRILPVYFDSQGTRRREFNIAVGLMNDTPPQGGGLQLTGPATVMNILKGMRDQNFTPTTFHEHWLRVGEIPKGDRSIYEHECLSRILEAFVTIDQVNAPALQGLELICRRMQVIREAHRISPSAPDYSAADHFMGWRYRKASQVDSDLAAHVATELKNEAAIAKESRKAREEQNLRRRPPKGPKGGDHGGGGGEK